MTTETLSIPFKSDAPGILENITAVAKWVAETANLFTSAPTVAVVKTTDNVALLVVTLKGE